MKTTNIFKPIFLSLIVIQSIFALFGTAFTQIAFFNTADYSLNLGLEGINNYLTAFGKYKELYSSIIITFAAYFGLWQLKASNDANTASLAANEERIKQIRFSEWKSTVETTFNEVDENNIFMKNEFIGIRQKLFNQLYVINFTINNKTTLSEIFNENIKYFVETFESGEKEYLEIVDYSYATQIYSFDTFCLIFRKCIEYQYSSMFEDLRALYLQNLNPNRFKNIPS